MSEALKKERAERRALEAQQDSDAQDFVQSLKVDMFSDEVFVFTPKGDIIDLPKGALPLDFAYRLHSEIGDHVMGVKINGKMRNLNTRLNHGDVVEILTSKNASPRVGWLDKIKTSHARQKLRSQLSKLGKN